MSIEELVLEGARRCAAQTWTPNYVFMNNLDYRDLVEWDLEYQTTCKWGTMNLTYQDLTTRVGMMRLAARTAHRRGLKWNAVTWARYKWPG